MGAILVVAMMMYWGYSLLVGDRLSRVLILSVLFGVFLSSWLYVSCNMGSNSWRDGSSSGSFFVVP